MYNQYNSNSPLQLFHTSVHHWQFRHLEQWKSKIEWLELGFWEDTSTQGVEYGTLFPNKQLWLRLSWKIKNGLRRFYNVRESQNKYVG